MKCLRFWKGLGWLPVLTFILMVITIVTAYVISRALKLVLSPLPYISDTGTLSPASCWFGLLLTLVGFCLFLCGIVQFLQIREHLGHEHKLVKVFNILALVIGMAGVFGILMVAAFQETQALSGHIFGAFLTFSSASCYALLQSILLTWLAKRSFFFNHKCLIIFRYVLTAICFITFLIVAVCCWKTGKVLPPNARDPPYDHAGYYYVSTSSEWILVVSFFVFILTFVHEFSKLKAAVVVKMFHMDLFSSAAIPSERQNVDDVASESSRVSVPIEMSENQTNESVPNDAPDESRTENGTLPDEIHRNSDTTLPDVNN